MKALSKEWTAEDRIRVVSAMLPGIQEDIYAGTYSTPGRPNITSLQHILHEPASELERIRGQLETIVNKHEKKVSAWPTD